MWTLQRTQLTWPLLSLSWQLFHAVSRALWQVPDKHCPLVSDVYVEVTEIGKSMPMGGQAVQMQGWFCCYSSQPTGELLKWSSTLGYNTPALQPTAARCPPRLAMGHVTY